MTAHGVVGRYDQHRVAREFGRRCPAAVEERKRRERRRRLPRARSPLRCGSVSRWQPRRSAHTACAIRAPPAPRRLDRSKRLRTRVVCLRVEQGEKNGMHERQSNDRTNHRTNNRTIERSDGTHATKTWSCGSASSSGGSAPLMRLRWSHSSRSRPRFASPGESVPLSLLSQSCSCSSRVRLSPSGSGNTGPVSWLPPRLSWPLPRATAEDQPSGARAPSCEIGLGGFDVHERFVVVWWRFFYESFGPRLRRRARERDETRRTTATHADDAPGAAA